MAGVSVHRATAVVLTHHGVCGLAFLLAYLLAGLLAGVSFSACLRACLLACLPACLPACLLACLRACLLACLLAGQAALFGWERIGEIVSPVATTTTGDNASAAAPAGPGEETGGCRATAISPPTKWVLLGHSMGTMAIEAVS